MEERITEKFPSTKRERFKNMFVRHQKLKLMEQQKPMKIGSVHFNDKQLAEIQDMIDKSVEWGKATTQ